MYVAYASLLPCTGTLIHGTQLNGVLGNEEKCVYENAKNTPQSHHKEWQTHRRRWRRVKNQQQAKAANLTQSSSSFQVSGVRSFRERQTSKIAPTIQGFMRLKIAAHTHGNTHTHRHFSACVRVCTCCARCVWGGVCFVSYTFALEHARNINHPSRTAHAQQRCAHAAAAAAAAHLCCVGSLSVQARLWRRARGRRLRFGIVIECCCDVCVERFARKKVVCCGGGGCCGGWW